MNQPVRIGRTSLAAMLTVACFALSGPLGDYGRAQEPRAVRPRGVRPRAVQPAGNPQRAPAFPFPAPEAFNDLMQGGFADGWGKLSDVERARLRAVPVSPREESEAGRRAVQAKLTDLRERKIEVVQRGEDYDYVRQLVTLLRPCMQNRKRYPQIQVYLINSREIDARSFPGGTLFFTRGMLDFAATEAALVGVIGHELSHLDHGHQLLDLRRWKLAQDSFTGPGRGFSPQEFLRDGMLMTKMFSRPYQPEDEAEADLDGARWAYEAGYDPRAMGELFRRRQQADMPQLGFVEFLRSHPPNEQRHRAILELYGKLQQQQPRAELYLGSQNLARRIPRSRQEFAE
jgi:predicted Zn-dependent protease